VQTRALVGLLGVVAVGAATLAVVQPWDDDGPSADGTTTTSRPADPVTSEPEPGTPGARSAGDPYYPTLGNGGYDVSHYTLDLTWQADDGVLEGVVTIDAVATQALSRFNLDLSGMEVRSVTVDGEPARSARNDRELAVNPRVSIPEGADFRTVVTYRGKPEPLREGTELFDLGWITDGREAFVVSEPSGAETFYPVNNHPTDKATYTFRITTPEDQVAVANGLLVADNDTGHGTHAWTYEASDPMASYLVQIAVGDYELVDAGTVGDVVIRHALHRSLADEARSTVATTADMITLLDDVYGPYPFEAYGLLAVDEPLAFALETQTLTIIGSLTASEGRGADQLLLHELAHQWVGDTVSPSTWQDIWLNEGFATYSEWLWLERTGQDSAAETARSFEGFDELDPPPGDPGPDELFSAPVYYRGGMTLQALREAVGDVDFFEILRTWVEEHRDDTASTDDFIELSEEISGDQLDELFEEWLYAPELPSLG
jgi:aminopeptidase N